MDKNNDEPAQGDLHHQSILKADATRDKVSHRHQSVDYWNSISDRMIIF